MKKFTKMLFLLILVMSFSYSSGGKEERLSDFPLSSLILNESGEDFLDVKWGDVDGENGYRVFVDNIQNGNVLIVNTTHYRINNLLAGKNYSIKVEAFNSSSTKSIVNSFGTNNIEETNFSITMPSTFSGYENDNLSFIVSPHGVSNGGIVNYYWKFGDDQSSSAGNSVSHTYTNEGTYDLTVTASYNGQIKMKKAKVTIRKKNEVVNEVVHIMLNKSKALETETVKGWVWFDNISDVSRDINLVHSGKDVRITSSVYIASGKQMGSFTIKEALPKDRYDGDGYVTINASSKKSNIATTKLYITDDDDARESNGARNGLNISHISWYKKSSTSSSSTLVPKTNYKLQVGISNDKDFDQSVTLKVEMVDTYKVSLTSYRTCKVALKKHGGDGYAECEFGGWTSLLESISSGTYKLKVTATSSTSKDIEYFDVKVVNNLDGDIQSTTRNTAVSIDKNKIDKNSVATFDVKTSNIELIEPSLTTIYMKDENGNQKVILNKYLDLIKSTSHSFSVYLPSNILVGTYTIWAESEAIENEKNIVNNKSSAVTVTVVDNSIIYYTLTVTKPLDGVGYLYSEDNNIKCGKYDDQCSFTYAQGSNVKLFYNNNNTMSRLAEFTGDCSGKSCELTMNSIKTVGVVVGSAPLITPPIPLTTPLIEGDTYERNMTASGLAPFDWNVSSTPAVPITIDRYSGELIWKNVQAGDYNLTVGVRNRVGANSLTWNLKVDKKNSLPTVDMSSYLNIYKNKIGRIKPTINDIDGDIISISVSIVPAHGNITIASDEIMYVPTLDYVGEDTFTLEFNDGHGGVLSKNVKVTVAKPFVTMDTNMTVYQRGYGEIYFTLDYWKRDNINHQRISPKHGRLGIQNKVGTFGNQGRVTYTPYGDYLGEDEFTMIFTNTLDDAVITKVIKVNVIPKPNVDTDGDGIPDDREIALGLNPNSNDSDGDGYLDSEEIGDINSPLDTDNDGIINALDIDSDGDGVSDKEEREQGTDYLDDGDKPETLGITLAKTSYKLGLGLRDINLSIGVTGGDVKVTILNNEQDIFTTTKQWSGEWIDTNDYEDEGLNLTLKALKVESGLISIEVEDVAGESIKEDIFIEVIDIADFVENRSDTKMNLNDANATCMDMGARLPNINELRNVYQLVDNYMILDSYTPMWTATPSPYYEGYFLAVYGNNPAYYSSNLPDSENYVHCVKVQPVIDTDLVTVSLPKGWSNISLSPMTFEELVAKIGFEKLLIMQGALPQSSYRKLFVDQGRPYLNSLKNIEYGQGYWIKLDEAVEFTYNKAKYSGTQEILLKEGWNNIASLYTLTLEEIQEQLGMDNVLIIQGALPQSSYRKLFVDQGRPYLNSFEKFEPNQGYWIKLDHEAKLIYEFDLDEVARSNANSNLVRIETINGTEYTLKLFTNSQPQSETTNEAIIVFGLIDATNITMGLNSSYPNNSKFQVAIYDSDGNEVGRSEIVNFAEDSIDFGSLLIEG